MSIVSRYLCTQNAEYEIIMVVSARRDMSLATPPGTSHLPSTHLQSPLKSGAERQNVATNVGKNGTCCFISVMFSV